MENTIVSVRDITTAGYAVRPVTSSGSPLGDILTVANVGRLAKLPAAYAQGVLNVDQADLLRRFTRKTWVALTSDGKVSEASTTKREVLVAILDAHKPTVTL